MLRGQAAHVLLQSAVRTSGKRAFSACASAAQSPLTVVSHRPVFFDRVSPARTTSDDGVAESWDKIPAFRVLDGEGHLLEAVQGEWRDKVSSVPDDVLTRIYERMLMLPALDIILSSSQRQGRISFYMTSYGEEGAIVGSAAAWDDSDEVFAQYREVGVLIWRNVSLDSLLAQVFSSKADQATLGRQMPVHYGTKEHHFHTISSPLGTQIPQAAGAAYALKRTPGREQSCVVCYAGEGAFSEGDAHAGLNMASVLGGPIVFFARNNGFAISTPSSQQYKGDGIASRGPGYGIDTVRVDGNDPVAVYVACQEARRRAVDGQKAVLVEAMSYRVGHHSTSDDSSAYRSAASVESVKKLDSPLFRLRGYLVSRGLWSDEHEARAQAEHKAAIRSAFQKAERDKKPALAHLFGDVYKHLERPQREQVNELKRLVEKWGSSKDWAKELEKFDGGAAAFLKH